MIHTTTHQEAADAINVNDAYTDTTEANIQTGAAIEQAPSINTPVSMKSRYTFIIESWEIAAPLTKIRSVK